MRNLTRCIQCFPKILTIISEVADDLASSAQCLPKIGIVSLYLMLSKDLALCIRCSPKSWFVNSDVLRQFGLLCSTSFSSLYLML